MSLFRSRGFVAIVLVYAAISLISTQIPLLNYLGYEFSALIGSLGSVMSGLLTIYLVKPVYLSGDTAGRFSRISTSFSQAVLLNLVALVIPLVVMLTNAFFVKNCSLLQGLAFFMLIPVVSIWFGSALGFLCAVHYRFAKLTFGFYCFLLLAYSAAIGYFTPAIFSYNFLYGYFPGLTYDEALGLTWTLVLFRLLTIMIGAILVWLAALVARHCSPTDSVVVKGRSLLRLLAGRSYRTVAGTSTVVLGIVWIFRGEFGFESTSGYIQSTLGAAYRSEHFIIYYSKESYDDDEVRWISAEHEFRLKQITDAFFISFNGTIESYIYPSSNSKQRLIGTGTTNIAKPWSGQIQITKQSLDGTLKHELVHVLAAPFGLPVIRASVSTGLVEGLAMAIEWEWGNRTPHQYAAAMRKFDVMPDIEPLMLLTGFASQASSVSYVLCGSFCKFLIDRYGIRKMMQVYRNGDYNIAYARSLQQLIAEWHSFLDRIPVADQDRDAIDVIFRRPAIFKKVCARVVAERNIEARKRYDARDYVLAEALFKESYLEVKGYDALGGYIASALRSGNARDVTSILDSIIMKDSHPAQYLPLFITIGDAYWSLGDKRRASELYRRARQANLSQSLNESAALRIDAMKDTDSLMHSYFMSDANDTLRLKMLNQIVAQGNNEWMVRYLKGRLLLRMNRFQESCDTLSSLVPAPEDSLLESLRLRMVGYDLFRLRRFQDARTSFWTSLNYLDDEVARNEVDDWVERCEWMETYDPG